MVVNDGLVQKALSAGMSLARGTVLIGQIVLERSNRIYSGSLTNVSLGAYSYIVSGVATSLSVGRYCSIAHGVEFGFYTHPTDWLTSHPFVFNPYMPDPLQWPVPMRMDPSPQPIVLGHDVWIGAHAKIMGGVEIGNGAIIATGSIVTKDVEPWSIVGGSPARVIRKRFNQKVSDDLSAIKWWNYDWPTAIKDGAAKNIEWNSPEKAVVSIRNFIGSDKSEKYKIRKQLKLFHEEPGCKIVISGK